MKKGLITAVIIGTLLGLTSCGETPLGNGPEEQGNWSEVVVKLQDGRSIRCLVFDGYSKGGPSCDWANAR